RADPAAPEAWNPVVASLVYRAATAVADDPAAPAEARAQAAAVRAHAAAQLDPLRPPLPDRPRAVRPAGRLRDLIPAPAARRPRPYNAPQFGWHRYPGAWVWGAQALVFSRDAAQRYLRDRHVCQHRWRSAGDGLSQIDVLIGWWARRRRVPVWFPTPSLIQHV